MVAVSAPDAFAQPSSTSSASASGTSLPRTPPDAFYQRLLRDGIAAAERGDNNRALRDLRLASFGFLDHTPQLVEALGRLALVQHTLGDRAGFRETFARIVEVEDLFSGSWQAAGLGSELRDSLSQRAAEEVSSSVLANIPAFRDIARLQAAREISTLTGDARRIRLEEQIQREPDSLLWRVELADAYVADGRPAEANVTLSETLEASLRRSLRGLSPLQQRALCLRGEARAALGQAQAAADDLSRCPAVSGTMHFARALMESYLGLGQLAPAAALLPTLEPEVREHRDIRRLARELEDAQEERAQQLEAQAAAEADAAADSSGSSASAPSSYAEGEPSAPGPAAEGQSAGASNEATLPGIAQSQLDRARRMKLQARRIADLQEPMRLAVEVADAYPQHREAQHLVAEIAYRARQWRQAVSYYERGGVPGNESPYQQFFYAVALYESGRGSEAATVLNQALPRIERDEFVNQYAERILGAP
ncbi:MAG: hypothetical protein AAGD01_06565 [Acidobacteriota bacterium]